MDRADYEALRLARLLVHEPAGDIPVVHALFALMLHASRLTARCDFRGEVLLLGKQSRALWDRGLIEEGLEHLARAGQGSRLTAYHLEAGIAAAHAAAHTYEETDWGCILWYYDALLEIAPSPVAAMNRAVAVAMVHGSHAGMNALQAAGPAERMKRYPLYHAVLGAFHHIAGDWDDAVACYGRSLKGTLNDPDRRWWSEGLRCAASGPRSR